MKPLSEIQKEVEKVSIEVMAYAFEKGKEDDDFVGKEEKAKAKVWADRLLALIRSDREEMEKILGECRLKQREMFGIERFQGQTIEMQNLLRDTNLVSTGYNQAKEESDKLIKKHKEKLK